MMSKTVVNVLSVVNSSSKVVKKVINNKEHIIIKDVVPVVDDVVMNGGLYPKDEINKSYQSIDGNLMPLGHPKVNGNYVSANNPKAINEFYGGAWAESVRKEQDKVLLDAYVDVEFARNHEKGRLLLERLEQMMNGEDASPIHVSTGLILNKEQKTGKSKGKTFSWVARNMRFDHVAILLNEQGAATPAEGVGIFVNSEWECNVECANLIESVNFTKEGVINKVKFFLFNNSAISFEDIYGMISSKLNTDSKPEEWRYLDAVYPGYFIYSSSKIKFKQSYLIDSDQKINFVGDAVEVKKTVVYDEIKTNGENQAMKNMILAALNAKGIKTDGLTDEQLLSAFNEQAAKDALAKKKTEEDKDEEEPKDKAKDKKNKEQAQNVEQVPAWAKTLMTEFNGLKQTFAANAEIETKAMREAVKAKFNITETAVNSLSDEPLKELYAQCQGAAPLNPSFKHNSNQSISDMPE